MCACVYVKFQQKYLFSVATFDNTCAAAFSEVLLSGLA